MLLPKILLPAATAATGLGLAVLSPQDTAPTVTTTTPTQTVQVANADGGDETTDQLADLYARLRKIRSERLVDRPKKLSDDAAKIYRDALAAVENKDEAKAKALTEAARELTRALELSLNSRDKGPEDPDLPPPPRRLAQRVYLYRTDAKTSTLPPILDGDKEGGIHTRVVTVPRVVEGTKAPVTVHTIVGDEKAVAVPGNVRLRIVDGKPEGESRDVVVKRLQDHDDKVIELHGRLAKDAKPHDETARAQAVHARALATEAHKHVAETLHSHIEALKTKDGKSPAVIELKTDGHQAVNVLRLAEAKAKLHESLAGVHAAQDGKPNIQVRLVEKGKDGAVDADDAISQLKHAYETVSKARKEAKKDESAHYLDAARELYNAARREAEAKHYDRAAELARAAEALTKVDHALGAVRIETHVKTDGGEDKKVYHYELKAGEPKHAVTIQPRELHLKAGELTIKPDDAKKTETRKVEVRVNKEKKAEDGEHTLQLRVVDPSKPEGGKAGDDESVQGIGVMITFDGGKAEVTDLVKGGPAAADGKIKPGDVIIGVIKENGATVGFGDKELGDVTKLLRGPVGSKVNVLVQPKGSSDFKTIVIERKKLDLPKSESEKPAPPKPSGGGALPPVLD